MLHDSAVHSRPALAPPPLVCYNLVCGLPPLAQLMALSLGRSGFRCEPGAPTTVLVDAPQGFAMRQLEQLAGAHSQVVVQTSNPCPEYLEDLWEQRPAVLLATHALNGELEDAIRRADRGERYRITPGQHTTLTTTERTLLRCLARGWTTERIAALRHVQPKTVHNALAIVCEKLQLPTRRAAMLYYWGRLDLLD